MPHVLWCQALRFNYLCKKCKRLFHFCVELLLSFITFYLVCVVHGVHAEVRKQLVRIGSVYNVGTRDGI